MENTIKVGITGQQGFVGSHLYNFLGLQKNIKIIPFKKKYFEDPPKLVDFVMQCDTIVHLAAINRHADSKIIYDTNINLVEKLIAACKNADIQPHILMSSSTQESNDNPYGKSKKIGRELLETWAKNNNAITTGMIIPNVFGPFGRPFYNSVVATFCHQLANDIEPTILADGQLKLIYINELILDIYNIIVKKTEGRISISHRYEIKVSNLLSQLKLFKKKYIGRGEFPSIETPFNLALFNTFRCYISSDFYPRKFLKHEDYRGCFVEIVRANTSGQFSFSLTKPTITRGNHFHTRKAERFAVIKGRASIKLRKIDSDEVIEYIIDGREPAFVDMPIWYTHNIKNIGDDDLITLFWINELYNSEDPDTYFINVDNIVQ